MNRYSKTIHTSNYPEDYDVSQNCTWSLRVPPKRRLKLKAFQYIIEEDVSCAGNCCYDYLKIYDGWSEEVEQEITTLCGNGIQENIVSSGTDLLIKFTSDKAITKSGFQIHYEIMSL